MSNTDNQNHAAHVPAPAPGPAVTSATAVPEPDSGSAAEFNKRQDERREKAAEAETERAADENRLPESGAVTNPAPATAADMTPGGAFIEPEIKQAIPVDHPAIENNPRAGTSAVQNGADFNDPFGRYPGDPDFVGQGIDRSVYGKKAEDHK